MGKLLFSLIIFAVSPLVFADDAPCHIPIESKAHGTKWGEVTCLHCKEMDDFANFGAANMVDNLSSYTRMTVKNVADDKQVLVTASETTRPTFLSVGYGIFSHNVRVYDHMNLEVSARTIKGRVTGKSWNSERTDVRHLRQACKTAAEDERKAAEEMRKKAEEEQSNDASSGSGSPRLTIDMQLQMQAALRDMIKHGAFRGWMYRGGLFAPAEFLRPCSEVSGESEGNDYVSRCHRG